MITDNVLVTITQEAHSERPAAQFAAMLLDMIHEREGFEND